MSSEARRRQVTTIVAQSPSPYDASRPLPGLRVPSFGADVFGPHSARQQENRRISGVACVLLVSLLVVAGAVTGINYAAVNHEKSPNESKALTAISEPRVVLERLPANALVSRGGTMQVSQVVGSAEPLPSPPSLSEAPSTRAPSRARASTSGKAVQVDTSKVESPWQPNRTTTSSEASQKAKDATKKRLDAKSIDTETPLIMD